MDNAEGGRPLSPAARALLEQRSRRAAEAAVSGTPRREGARAPLSYAQQRVWIFEQLEPGTPVYLLPKLLELRGPLDPAALERALNALVERHEALRTRYLQDDAGLRQEALPASAARVPLPRLDVAPGLSAAEREHSARARLAALGRAPFDLAGGALPRATLAPLADDAYLLQVVFHHIAFDGWSTAVFVRELGALYNAVLRGAPDPLATLPPLPLQVADLALRERAWAVTGEARQDLDWWRAQLADAPVDLGLPADHALPAQRGYTGGLERLDLPSPLVARLRELGRSERATLFATVLAGFQALLARHTGAEDVVIGTPIAGRGSPQVAAVIGQLINTLALRGDLSGDPSFRQLVGRARDVSRSAFGRAGPGGTRSSRRCSTSGSCPTPSRASRIWT